MTDQTFILNKKTSLHHSPAPLTIKKENGSPQKGKATEVHTNFAYKEIVSCHFTM